MRTIKLIIAYDGTDFSGWQVQPGKRTVQGEMTEAVSRVVGSKTSVHCSGRTDAGVHALGQVAHFQTDTSIPSKKIAEAVNSFLPDDITVKKTEEVCPEFHARFSAKSKLYCYRIFLSEIPDPFRQRYSWRFSKELDTSLMAQEIKSLEGKHDFSAFRASGSSVKSSVREVYRSQVLKRSDMVDVIMEANGFLYNMMRNVTGTLVEIGRGYFSPGSMQEILLGKDRKKAGPTAPPSGLFLLKVNY